MNGYHQGRADVLSQGRQCWSWGLPGSPAGTGHAVPVWLGRAPEAGAGQGAPSSGLTGPGQNKPVLTQRRQSPPAPSPPCTSGQLQSEPDWGAELG